MHRDARDWPEGAWLNRSNLTRLVGSIIASEVAHARGQDMQRLRPDEWSSDTSFLEAGLALDSLERTNCAAALNQFFHLSEYGAEDYLLAAETLEDWTDIVAVSIANGSGRLTFQTSGSTGPAKACTHDLARLTQEAEFWAGHFGHIQRIAAMVPPHHIFGFLFTVLLPQLAGLEVVDLRYGGASALKHAMSDPNGLVVGAPAHWQYLSCSFLQLPAGIHGVTSTAPMPQQLRTHLRAQGLESLTEVYGSSETAGVGFRTKGNAAYRLLPYWDVEMNGDRAQLRHTQTNSVAQFMDKVAPGVPGTFTILGRLDGGVQVAGVNVFPMRVADLLRTQPQVADCAVRLCPNRQRLVAFIVPTDRNSDMDALEDALRATCRAALKTAERPTAFRFGREVPRNSMGKIAAWS